MICTNRNLCDLTVLDKYLSYNNDSKNCRIRCFAFSCIACDKLDDNYRAGQLKFFAKIVHAHSKIMKTAAQGGFSEKLPGVLKRAVSYT